MIRLTKGQPRPCAPRWRPASSSGDGVEWSTYVLLFHLIAGGPMRTKALAESVGVDPSTVSRQVESSCSPASSSAAPTPTTAARSCWPPPTRAARPTAGCASSATG